MRTMLAVIVWLIGGLGVVAQVPEWLSEAVREDYPWLEGVYKELHAHPELSFYEYQTAARLAQELRTLGFEVTEQVGGTGIVGVLRNGEGPVILVRTDMDALPVVEATGLPYASTVRTKDEAGKEVGVMHACGHDVHMTVWLGTARALARHRDQWSGTLVFIGQPAEERGGGAKAMLGDGLYERFPYPDYALALHVSSNLPAGTLGYCPGYAMANVDMVDILVRGRGGHGAYPHTTIDPIVLSARIIMALQTIVSREISPIEPAVLTVGAIHGGTKGNVIPDEVALQLTLRSYKEEVRLALIEKIKRICQGEAMSAGLSQAQWPQVKVRAEHTPALYNDPSLTQEIVQVFRAAFGDSLVVQLDPEMVGEDFARYGLTEPRVPIFMFRLGAANPVLIEQAQRGEAVLPSLHSAQFAPLPEPTIQAGVQAMTMAVYHLLRQGH